MSDPSATRSAIRAARAIIRKANRVAFHVAHAALWLLTAVVLYDVFFRSFGNPSVWGAEVSVYLMIALSFLGIGHTWVQGGHFSVTLLTANVPPNARRALEFVCAVLALSFTVALTAGAWRLAAFSHSLDFTTPTVLKMPLWILQSLLVAGGAFLGLALVEDLLRIALGEEAGADKLAAPVE